MPPGRIQQLISTALSLRAWQPQVSSPASPDDPDQLLVDLASLPEWEPWPMIGIQLTPRPRGAAIEDFYGTFRANANNWSDIRASSFGLRLELQPLEPEGDRLRSGKVDRTRLTVSHDGVVTAVALAAPGFLGWALNKDDGPLEAINISAYPLIEFFAETIRFGYGVVAKALDPFEGWDIGVQARHLIDRTPASFQLRARAAIYPLDARLATTDRIDRCFRGSGDWDRDAFRYVATLLGVGFSIGESDVLSLATDVSTPSTSSDATAVETLGRLETNSAHCWSRCRKAVTLRPTGIFDAPRAGSGRDLVRQPRVLRALQVVTMVM